MKLTSPEFLYQVSHLLDGLEDTKNSPERKKQIDTLRFTVNGLIHLALQGNELAVAVGLGNISEDIERLVLEGADTQLDLPFIK